jgi:hypothetical protein
VGRPERRRRRRRSQVLTRSASLSDKNPYVGPRPIQQGEPLYGRRVKVADLYHLLQARRIVVLHSSSSAGKSSLVQAGHIPRLKEGKFDADRGAARDHRRPNSRRIASAH